jgi:putative oxidoreductase
MATQTFSAVSATGSQLQSRSTAQASTGSKVVFLLGRILFAAIFVMAGPSLFSIGTIAYAAQAGVPAAKILVPIAAVLAILGGLSVLLGYRARLGAWLLVAFLVPVTLAMHKFWGISDPAAAQVQMAHFMKNVSMLGAALLIASFGAGPVSLDARRESRN